METFPALLAICAGNSPVPGEFPTQRPVTRSFDVYFDLRSDKRLSKQSWGWWFETLSRSLWRHRNEYFKRLQYTVECRYNAVHFNMILYTSLHELRRNISQMLDSQNTTIPRPNGRAGNGVSFVNILKKIDTVITTLCTISVLWEQ